jgi:hypothetical protein
MYIITYKEIIDLNHKLEEQQLHFRVHLKDMCGKQSLWLEYIKVDEANEDEAIEDESNEKEETIALIEQFFAGKGTVRFTQNSLEFVLQ